jgi:hypothetical protein
MNPGFKSPSDVSISWDSWVVNGQGIPHGTVTEDIDGNLRSTSLASGGCDIGASEYYPAGYALTTRKGQIGKDTTMFFGVDGKKVAEIIWSGENPLYPDTIVLTYTPGQRAILNSGNISNRGIDRMYSFSFPGNGGWGWTAEVKLFYNSGTEIRDYNEMNLVVNKRPLMGDGLWDVEASGIDTALHCARFVTSSLGTYTLVDGTQGPLPVEKAISLQRLSYALEQNYPNPFNPVTKIRYSIREDGKVRLTLFNSIGQAVRVLLDEMKTKGSHEIILNAGELPSGVYFYNLQSGGFKDTKKLRH